MPETPEIPEAKDPFEKCAAITVAILAVVLAILGNKAENARTEAIIKTNKAADGWAHYQAKSIKAGILTAEQELLTALAPAQTAAAKIPTNAERLKKIEDYKTEQKEIEKEALDAQKEAGQMLKISEGCEHGSLALQIAIVLASVSILARSRAFWIASVILGLLGAVVGGMAFFIAH